MIICRHGCCVFLAVALWLVGTADAGTWPTNYSATVTSAFGPRCDGFTAKYHAGWDIRNWDVGGFPAQVIAARAGTVTLPSWTGYHYSVVLNHGDGKYTGYHHIRDAANIYVESGDSVEEGEVIGIAPYEEHDHMHFNYWEAEAVDDDNTSHPGKCLGDIGDFEITVGVGYGVSSSLVVRHGGDILEVGVGIAESDYGLPTREVVPISWTAQRLI